MWALGGWVSDASMIGKAQKVGFTDAKVMAWGASERVGDVTITAVREHTMMGKTSSNDVISGAGLRLFVATEALDVGAAEDFARTHPACDVAIGACRSCTYNRGSRTRLAELR